VDFVEVWEGEDEGDVKDFGARGGLLVVVRGFWRWGWVGLIGVAFTYLKP